MLKKDIKKLLEYPVKNKVYNLLNKTNLKLSELRAIELVDMQGMTEEEAAFKMDVSSRSVQSYRSKAYKKMSIAFDTFEETKELLD